jgi:hypothetical protein
MFYKYGNLTWRLEIEWLIWGEGNVAAAFWSKKSAMNDNDLVVFNEFPPDMLYVPFSGCHEH